MGLVTKRILDNINGRLKEKLDVTLWKNSAAVIEWFQSIEMKENFTFMNFDVVEFYPITSKDLLNRAISFAKKHTPITNEEVDVIFHSTKSLLLSNDKAWMKKEGSGLFDVAMESYDSAEVCQLVGMFALSQLPRWYNRCDIALYRDDGLAFLGDVREYGGAC